MRRIGSNIRKQTAKERPSRVTRSIIQYSAEVTPRNDYPKKIVSPPYPSDCCIEDNRLVVGNIREAEGFKFCYKICKQCGHAVKYYFPAIQSTSEAVKEYRSWKKYLVQ